MFHAGRQGIVMRVPNGEWGMGNEREANMPRVKQGREGQPVQFYVSAEVLAQLRELCERNRTSLSAELRRAVELYLVAPEVRVGVPGPRRAGKTG